ncbi:MAG: hypothetical protein ACE5HA_18055, partial [Anaerolineae bacterium]
QDAALAVRSWPDRRRLPGAMVHEGGWTLGGGVAGRLLRRRGLVGAGILQRGRGWVFRRVAPGRVGAVIAWSGWVSAGAGSV